MHPALIFAICFIVVSIVCLIIYVIYYWKNEIGPAIDNLSLLLFGVTPPANNIQQAAVSALQTASGPAFQVRFRSDQSDEQPQPGQMSQVEGQMTKPGGQIDQQGGQIGQDVNPWPLLHSQEGQIPGETIEEAQETK
mgnify:FL=1